MKVGDKVLVPCTIIRMTEFDDDCNVVMKTEPAQPSGSVSTIALSSTQLFKGEGI